MMQTTINSVLERNLAALGQTNADVVAALRETPPSSDIEFTPAGDGAQTAVYRDVRLASAHRPLEEAQRAVARIDLVGHAVVVACGFGLGHHIAELARSMKKCGVILVFEPDMALLRAVFERIDCSEWLAGGLVVFIRRADDAAELASKLRGAEAILAQGVAFVEHTANRKRLGDAAVTFTDTLTKFVTTSKTTLLTTLVRSADTVQNLLWNIDHYAFGEGVAELKGTAAGSPAVVVSAGPSLRRNMHLLAQPGVRETCVIIAAQTVLKTLLDANIRPHFVTALDYHEISKRFYEGLTPDDVRGVTLIVDPKAHPIILDSFPGRVRCCRAAFLDDVLGAHARAMGDIPGGATVAHLAFYMARHLGCNPIAFIGQDLGFTDGLYYGPGTAIHDVWSPELNPFNTIEMMEWQRIVRHRVHLSKQVDHGGREIFTDAQMLAYLQQFERDFAAAAAEGVRIVDATEGGVRKAYASIAALEDVLDQHATTPLPEVFIKQVTGDAGAERTEQRSADAESVRARIASVRADVERLERISRETSALLQEMLAHHEDEPTVARLLSQIEKKRAEVEMIFDAFQLLNQFNQMAVFKRQRADRRLQIAADLDPKARQRMQVERDLENVTWTADASAALADMLRVSEEQLRTRARWQRPTRTAAKCMIAAELDHVHADPIDQPPARIVAILPVDPEHNALGWPRSLTTVVGGKSILQHTLARIATAQHVSEIILIVPNGFDLDVVIDQHAIAKPVIVERVDGSPFGPECAAIAPARIAAATCWRGALAGLSAWDEVLCPQIMHRIMLARGIAAAIVCGPDWPLVDVSPESGVDAMAARYREHPDRHNLIFSQAPPGLGACLVSATLMQELAERNRLSTIGGLLVYQPHAPQGDPIARDANVEINPTLRSSFIRATADTPEQLPAIENAIRSEHTAPEKMIASFDATPETPPLTQLVIELCSRRISYGQFAQPWERVERPLIAPELVLHLLDQLATPERTMVTFGGAGDPLLHPEFAPLVAYAKALGIGCVHVRTELRCERDVIDTLIACKTDIVSIDLHADRAATYLQMMGADTFGDVIANIEYLISKRRRLSSHIGTGAWALPWVVPRIMRCATTLNDIDSFFDRWQAMLGTVMIDAGPSASADDVLPTWPPHRAAWHQLMQRMIVLSDGSVPIAETDLSGARCVDDTNLSETPLADTWARLVKTRCDLRGTEGPASPLLRIATP